MIRPLTRPLRVGIIGCGQIGRKRAEALEGDQLIACYDIDPAASTSLADSFDATVASSLSEFFAKELDITVVATRHCDLAALSCQALGEGTHVLVEKPAGVGVSEIDEISNAAHTNRLLVKVGFNHRFHSGVMRAVTSALSGEHGQIMSMRARYGHGGRLGYENEWRADPALSGGGEIVDQGMHLLDLSYWLLGELPLHSSLLRTQYWRAPVDDNANILLGSQGGVGTATPFAILSASWTEWKNLFSLEINCRDAKFVVDGLARSYGPQTLRIYRMRPELGPPDLEEFTYPDQDTSWSAEWRHFTSVLLQSADERDLLGNLASARYAWSIVQLAQQ